MDTLNWHLLKFEYLIVKVKKIKDYKWNVFKMPLFDEVVIALSAPTTPSLGASSQALGGTVV
jgi:hypothetical protein